MLCIEQFEIDRFHLENFLDDIYRMKDLDNMRSIPWGNRESHTTKDPFRTWICLTSFRMESPSGTLTSPPRDLCSFSLSIDHCLKRWVNPGTQWNPNLDRMTRMNGILAYLFGKEHTSAIWICVTQCEKTLYTHKIWIFPRILWE